MHTCSVSHNRLLSIPTLLQNYRRDGMFICCQAVVGDCISRRCFHLLDVRASWERFLIEAYCFAAYDSFITPVAFFSLVFSELSKLVIKTTDKRSEYPIIY